MYNIEVYAYMYINCILLSGTISTYSPGSFQTGALWV